jgi:hypothetical protein
MNESREEKQGRGIRDVCGTDTLSVLWQPGELSLEPKDRMICRIKPAFGSLCVGFVLKTAIN